MWPEAVVDRAGARYPGFMFRVTTSTHWAEWNPDRGLIVSDRDGFEAWSRRVRSQLLAHGPEPALPAAA